MSLSGHSAPGSNAGFTFQYDRALYRLAQSSGGDVVGIETDDDVAVRSGDGTQLLEQAKHSIQEEAAPFGDRSRDLWNTLDIWVSALAAGEIPESTRFCMVTNKRLPPCIAKNISAAQCDADIDACIAELKTAAINPPEKIKNLVPSVLAAEKQGALRRVIAQCEVSDSANGSANADLRKKIVAHLPLPDSAIQMADSIIDELIGWLHATCLSKWQNNQPAWIPRNHFINQLYAILENRRKRMARERAEHLLPVPQADIHKESGSTFVKQLHLVTDDSGLVDGAIRDLLRCRLEKGRLSAEGNITDHEWTEFSAELIRRWDIIAKRHIRLKTHPSEEDLGFAILSDTVDHRQRLAGAETDQTYLTAGSYHQLADNLDVGWHPRYEEILNPPPGK